MLLEIVKSSLLIPLDETLADLEVMSYIKACKELLISSGIDKSLVNSETDSIVQSLVIIYCKTFFGFKNDGSVKELPKSFDMLVKQLALTKSTHL